MLSHSICTGSHSRIGPERGHLYNHLQGVPVVPGREEPHTIFHGHAIFNYLKKAWLKRQQDQADADLAKKEAERLKMEKEINEQVAARLKKEKVENKFNPDISLAPA